MNFMRVERKSRHAVSSISGNVKGVVMVEVWFRLSYLSLRWLRNWMASQNLNVKDEKQSWCLLMRVYALLVVMQANYCVP